MRILCAIVLPLPALMTAVDPQIASGGVIRPQVVGDHPIEGQSRISSGVCASVSARRPVSRCPCESMSPAIPFPALGLLAIVLPISDTRESSETLGRLGAGVDS